jgi:hypothetical protein
MNVTEIRKAIRQSEHKSWYNSLSIQLEFLYGNFDIDLVGIDMIYQFFKDQLDFYENNEPLPDVLKPSKKYFKQCKTHIESFATKNLINKGSNKEGEWNVLKRELLNKGNIKERYFNKESETTDFLIKLDSEYNEASIGAYDFLTDQSFNYNNSNKNYFIGWHRAYEFFTQDADLIKRRNNEKQTLSRIRSEYLKKLLTTDKQVDDHIAQKEQLYIDKEKSISRLIKKKNTQYENWKSDNQNKFSEFLSSSDKAFKELEIIYKEKLKLEAPAKYWNDRAVKLKKEGKNWLKALITSSVIAILSLGTVLYFISNGTLKDLFSSSGSAIRWSIVFITFVSFLAYGIRIFAKLTFSSYHLVRDAEEREQLAYVFLALKKEKNIDPTEQHLIMQSLFSRADSGLLKDDSSPTMPGGSMIEKLMGGK